MIAADYRGDGSVQNDQKSDDVIRERSLWCKDFNFM